jgi:hypothetical protein
MSPTLITENINIKIYRIIIFPVAGMGVKGGLSCEELRVLEKRVLMKTFQKKW